MIHIVHAFFSKMSAGPVIHRYLYQSFFGIPLLVAAQAPGIHNCSGVGAAINIDQYRIFFVLIHIHRPGYFHRQLVQAIVAFYPDDLCFSQVIIIKLGSFTVAKFFHDLSFVAYQCHLCRRGCIGIRGDKIRTIRRKVDIVIVFTQGKTLHILTIDVYPVKIISCRILQTSCCEINNAFLFIYISKIGYSELTRSNSIHQLPFHVVEIHVLPAAGIAEKNKASFVFHKTNSFAFIIQVNPGFLFLVIKLSFGTGGSAYFIDDEVIL